MKAQLPEPADDVVALLLWSVSEQAILVLNLPAILMLHAWPWPDKSTFTSRQD